MTWLLIQKVYIVHMLHSLLYDLISSGIFFLFLLHAPRRRGHGELKVGKLRNKSRSEDYFKATAAFTTLGLVLNAF